MPSCQSSKWGSRRGMQLLGSPTSRCCQQPPETANCGWAWMFLCAVSSLQTRAASRCDSRPSPFTSTTCYRVTPRRSAASVSSRACGSCGRVPWALPAAVCDHGAECAGHSLPRWTGTQAAPGLEGSTRSLGSQTGFLQLWWMMLLTLSGRWVWGAWKATTSNPRPIFEDVGLAVAAALSRVQISHGSDTALSPEHNVLCNSWRSDVLVAWVPSFPKGKRAGLEKSFIFLQLTLGFARAHWHDAVLCFCPGLACWGGMGRAPQPSLDQQRQDLSTEVQ